MATEREHILDIAARRKYRNQTEAYQRAYRAWSTDPKNPYGYAFVRDTREHTYVDGEGFLDETPQQSEKEALVNCYRLLGISMIIMASVALVRYIVMWLVFDLPYGGRSFYTTISENAYISDSAAYTLLFLNTLEYILPIFFLKAATRMSSKIAIPIRRHSKIPTSSAVLMMLVIMCIGRVYNSLCAYALSFLKIDIPYYDYISTHSAAATIICGLGQHVFLGILVEIILRGYLLQIFRQFGDSFAVLITAVAGSFMLYDITQIGYTFFTGIFTGVITIRSGSIKNACIMRVIARFITYMMTFVSTIVGAEGSHILELSFCMTVFVSALIVYVRINSKKKWSFEVSSEQTSVSQGEKLWLMLMSPSFWIWIVLSFVISLLMVKVL